MYIQPTSGVLFPLELSHKLWNGIISNNSLVAPLCLWLTIGFISISDSLADSFKLLFRSRSMKRVLSVPKTRWSCKKSKKIQKESQNIPKNPTMVS